MATVRALQSTDPSVGATTPGVDGYFLSVIDLWLDDPTNNVFANGGDASQDPYFGPIESWNTSPVLDMSTAFENGRAKVDGSTPNLVTTSFDDDISEWDTGNVTDMNNMFKGASSFSGSLTTTGVKWNVSKVRNMSNMFNGASDFNQPLASWNTINVTFMDSMFESATLFNQNIGVGSSWNTSNVTTMQNTFKNAQKFNQDISNWNTTKVSFMNSMFHGATAFNKTINYNSVSGDWNTINVSTMASMFEDASAYNKTCSSWNTSNVTDMSKMFKNATLFNKPIQKIGDFWNTAKVITYEEMFMVATNFNQDISDWTLNTTQNVTLKNMFNQANAFNQSIGGWSTQRVTDMHGMFDQARNFNQDIGSWDTSNVSFMNSMFASADLFNQDIRNWNTINVSNMNAMFSETHEFNADIGRWDTSNVTDIGDMFKNADKFNQNIRSWDTSSVSVALTDMFDGATLMINNYGGSNPVSGFAATPTNGDFFQQEFLELTWTSVDDNATVNIPLSGASGLNDFVDVIRWSNDGGTTYASAVPISTNLSFTNTTGGSVTIKARVTVNSVDGGYTRLGGTWTNGSKLSTVVVTVPGGSIGNNTRWGLGSPNGAATGTDPYLTSLEEGFLNCSGLTLVPSRSPDTITNMTSTFKGCTNFDSGDGTLLGSTLNTWQISNVTVLTSMFEDASSFSQEIPTWVTTSVVDMSKMFKGAEAFDEDIDYDEGSDYWNTASVTSMSEMFSGATAFGTSKGTITLWPTTALKDASSMFENATNFNKEIGTNTSTASGVDAWVTSTVTDMNSMFKGATAFDNGSSDTIGSWTVTAVTDMTSMFEDAQTFNRDINGWTPSAVVNGMSKMFKGATLFNCGSGSNTINGWNVGLVEDMSEMFSNADAFNKSIIDWNVESVTDMNKMFFGTAAFNTEISTWDVGNVTDMSSMFETATAFTNAGGSTTNSGTNRNGLNGWDVSSLNKITAMFKGATTFNEWIGNWDVNTGGTTDFSEMFSGATSFAKDCGLWNMSNATNLSNMFNGATSFNQNIRIWNTLLVTNYDDMFTGATAMGTIYNNDGTTGTPGFGNSPTSDFFNQEQLVFTFVDGGSGGEVVLPFWTGAGGTSVLGTMDTDIDVIRWNEGEAESLGAGGDQNLSFTPSSGQTFTARVTVLNSAGAGYRNLGTGNGFSYTTNNSLRSIAVEVPGGIQTDTAWSLGRTTPATGSVPTLISLNYFAEAQTEITSVPIYMPETVSTLSNAFKGAIKFNGSGVVTWNTSNVTDLEDTFTNTNDFNQDIGNWDTSKVINLLRTFSNSSGTATAFNQDLSKWDVRNVTDMETMFKGATAFNNGSNSRTNALSGRTGLNGWSPILTGDMSEMFSGATSFNRDLNDWETNALFKVSDMFLGASAFNGTLNGWNMSKVTNMTNMFRDAVLFNQYIGDWNTINVETMDNMFYDAGDFNQDISKWNTSNVLIMNGMFRDAESFNNGDDTNVNTGSTGDPSSRSGINGWNLSNVSQINYMFKGATVFNRYIGDWDVRAVTHSQGFNNMFELASAFNQDIGLWNTENVSLMTSMFEDATSMNQNLSGWDVTTCIANSSALPFTDMFLNATQMTGNQGFSATPTSDQFEQEILSFTFENVPDGTTLTIPLSGANSISANRDVIRWNTGDQTLDVGNNKLVAATTITNNPSYTNDTGSTLTITARVVVQVGTFSRLGGTYSGGSYLGEVHCTKAANFTTETQTQDTSWALNGVVSFEGLFQGCSTLKVVPKFIPDGGSGSVSAITSLKNSFNGCSVFGSTSYIPGDAGDNVELADWHTAGVTTTEGMFEGAAAFDKPISTSTDKWNMSSCVNMANMFYGATVFDQNITNWAVSSVSNMSQMFRDASAFDQAITTWNTSGLVIAFGMFQGASTFNQDIGTWTVDSVTTMADMFHGATLFDRDISSWVTTEVKTMNEMFKDATAIGSSTQGPGSDWDVSNVQDMAGMFENAVGFNVDIGPWDTVNVTTMARMFKGATTFDQDITTNINDWKVHLVTDMSFMFNGATNFSEPLYNWDTANVKDMTSMFESATTFNEDVGLWDVRSVTSFASTFKNATQFNKNIRIWETDSIVIPYLTTMNQMFNGATQIIAKYAGNTGFGIPGNQWSPEPDFFNQEKLLLTWTDVPTDGSLTELSIPLQDATGLEDNVDVIRWRSQPQIDIDSGLVYSIPNEGGGTTATITALITVYDGSYARLGGTWTNGSYLTSITTNKDTNKPATKWALNGLTSLEQGFEGCSGLTDLPTFCPPTLANLNSTFKDCTAFNDSIVNWDTANVTDMTSCFENAVTFNQGIGMWKTQNVTSMRFMFKNASSFNQYIRNWVIVNLTPYPTP